jgi:hypothetical protein
MPPTTPSVFLPFYYVGYWPYNAILYLFVLLCLSY